MSRSELFKKFIEFFEDRGHKLVPPSLLVPENDPSVLFTTAGMQQFKRFYLKPDLAPAKKVITIQPCFRTSDIDEVGDKSHLTLFEMLGNFTFGFTESERGSTRIATRIDADKNQPYFKKEAIEMAWEFLTDEKWLGLDKKNLSATFFEGNGVLTRDDQSEEILKTLTGLEKIEAQDQDENFWGPTGLEGPCGPTVEFHYDGLEVWNLVFNEYYFAENNYQPLEYKGVDTGAGLERLLVIINKLDDVYQTDILNPLVNIVAQSGIKNSRDQRIVADHIKAAIFAIADGVMPSNKDAGYVVRRLIRRSMIISGDASLDLFAKLIQGTIEIYGSDYPHVKTVDLSIINNEVNRWQPIKIKGEKIIDSWAASGENITGKMAFDLYQSHGFPIELTKELARQRQIEINEEDFWKEFESHKEISRAGVEGKFKGGLAGHSEIETRYHTAAHLLLQALRDLLGEKIFQRGSNITPERMRFDFSCPRALTEEELAEVEAKVNEKITEGLPVGCEEMTQAEAQKKGAVGIFKERYGEKVKIYTIGHCDKPYSMEFCGGPHVENTKEIGQLKIIKEQSAGAGIRRIRAVLK